MYNLHLYDPHLEVWIVQFGVYSSHFEMYNPDSNVLKLKNKNYECVKIGFRAKTLPYVTVRPKFDRSMNEVNQPCVL